MSGIQLKITGESRNRKNVAHKSIETDTEIIDIITLQRLENIYYIYVHIFNRKHEQS